MKNCYGKVAAEYWNYCESVCYKFRHRYLPESYFRPSKYLRKLYNKQQRQQSKVEALSHKQ